MKIKLRFMKIKLRFQGKVKRKVAAENGFRKARQTVFEGFPV